MGHDQLPPWGEGIKVMRRSRSEPDHPTCPSDDSMLPPGRSCAMTPRGGGSHESRPIAPLPVSTAASESTPASPPPALWQTQPCSHLQHSKATDPPSERDQTLFVQAEPSG